MAILASIPNGTTVIINGRSPNDEWVRIILPDSETGQLGWVSKQLITASDDLLSALHVVNPGEPQFGPMQAFYLSTGIGEPDCSEMPENGLLVQTPKGVGEINLLVNEVEISMGSTVFLSAPRDENTNNDERFNVNSMKVKTIEGAAISRRDGEITVALGGSQFEVIYDDDGEIEEISKAERLEINEIDDLPYDLLERDIEFEEPLTDEELDILDQYEYIFDLVDIDETDELLHYLDESGDDDLLEFLQDELGIDYFDSDTATYFEDELGFDIEGFDDDYYDDYSDGYDDYGDGYDDYSDGYNDYGDDYGDYSNSYDDYGDGDDYSDDYNDYDGDDYSDDYDDYDSGDDGGDDYD